MEVHLTQESIADSLEILTTEKKFYAEYWFSEVNTSLKRESARVLKDPVSKVTTPNLLDHVRILHKICVHNLVQRAGTFERVSNIDLLILYHLVKKKSLNLPYIILRTIMNAIATLRPTPCLPYGMALTRIFRYEGVLLEEYNCSDERTTFYSKNLKEMKLELKPIKEKSKRKK